MSELTITDQRLKPIADKVFAGERLSIDDGIRLYRSPDLLAVGWLANYVREKKHGNVTYFNVNRHITASSAPLAGIPTRRGRTTSPWKKFTPAPNRARAKARWNSTSWAACTQICRLNIFWK
jgi:hypothetical protein